MKRQQHGAWPKAIVEVPPRRPDPRSDPQATQKITREQLDDALKRTKSGTRPVARSEPGGAHDSRDSYAGPREDDAPEITIVRIDSMELSVIDPASLPPASVPSASPLAPSMPTSSFTPSAAMPRYSMTTTRRAHITPRLAMIAGVLLVTFVTVAAAIGFFAGRIAGH